MVEGKQQNGVVGRLKLLLNGRSTISRQGSLSSAASPKSIAPRLGVSILSSPTIDIPGISPYRSPTSRLPSPHSARELPSSTVNTLAEPPHTRPRQPAASASPPSPPLARTGRSSPRDGGWEHVRLNSDTAHGRGRRRKKARPRAAARSIFREKSGRFKLIRCVALGTLLAVGLTVYLALSLSDVIQGLQIHIFMIVIGLVLVMAFAHATVRLCMYILQPPQYPISRSSSNATVSPEEPIPVILRRDEEDISDEEAAVPKDAVLPVPPPAYGLWRGSTRMDPNLLHWRKVEALRREAAPTERNLPTTEQVSPYRPPSYATEDGVRYVLDAQPRSIAPEANSEPLPIHPSERGRIAPGML